VKSVDELKSFSWRQVILELRLKAPTFLTILQAVGECHQPRRKRRQKARNSVVGMAAAILLKERNQHMCKPQTVLSTVLYAGRASKKVYGRLNKCGVSITHRAAIRTIHSLADNYDADVLAWKDAASPEPNYILVGDNVDKNVSPRNMRVNNQVKSLHYFHMYAAQDRIAFSSASPQSHSQAGDISSLPASAVLPTVGDCIDIRENYIVLAARIIVNSLPHFAFLKNCIVEHIPHQFSKETEKKSVIVPLGVIPKNENVNEEMLEIMETMQQYIPTNQATQQVHTVAFGGDQLTVERCRGVQSTRVNSDNEIDALLGLHPFASDWHAEVTLLQVC
jgi:hypothetical protein